MFGRHRATAALVLFLPPATRIGARERVAHPAKLGPHLCKYIFPTHHLLPFPASEATFSFSDHKAHTLGLALT